LLAVDPAEWLDEVNEREDFFQKFGEKQPAAIRELSGGLSQGVPRQVLLGVTGSGKTYTMASVIASVDRPALVVAPNKTLAAQLYSEFRALFPENAVEYFVSYYDYYQPEAYVPQTDTFIEKDSAINEQIDKMRHSATKSVPGRMRSEYLFRKATYFARASGFENALS